MLWISHKRENIRKEKEESGTRNCKLSQPTTFNPQLLHTISPIPVYTAFQKVQSHHSKRSPFPSANFRSFCFPSWRSHQNQRLGSFQFSVFSFQFCFVRCSLPNQEIANLTLILLQMIIYIYM